MPKTAVGSFENADLADNVVREIEALGIPRKEIRTIEEPKEFEVTGVMSFPRLDFEVRLKQELKRIGATKQEAEFYLNGLKRGRALVFATGTAEKVEAAAAIMNRRSTQSVVETNGAEPQLPRVAEEDMAPVFTTTVQAGRISEPGEGAHFFVW